ncbi:hypothetical protein SLA2020_176030 [Shorea laevis]
MEGKYEEAEKYLSGFTTMDDNWHSMWVFFELRKQKYLEALEKKDLLKALDILLKELQDFNRQSETIFKEAMALLTLENFREHPSLAGYGDTQLERLHMVHSIKKSLLWNPMLQGKLHLPGANNFNVDDVVVNGEAEAAPLGGRHGNEPGRRN